MSGELLCQELFEDFKLPGALTHIRTSNVQGCIDLTGHLQFAIMHEGGAKAVQILLALGADIEGRDEHGRTPLYNAACRLKEGVCKILLEAGANTQFIRGTRPTIDITLIAQTDEHNYKQPLQTVPELLKIMGASVEGQLHRAIDTGKAMCVSRLLECGADIEELDRQGRTPIGHATIALQEVICEILLENGACTDSLNPQILKGCIHKAIKQGSTRSMVELLVKLGADIEELDQQGRTPLQHAGTKLQEGICEFLLDRGCHARAVREDLQLTPAAFGGLLHEAVRNRALKVAEVLLMMGADIEESKSFEDGWVGTPLHFAAWQGNSVAMIKLLLDQGANIAASTPESVSILHFAVQPRISSAEGLKYLLSRADMQYELLNSRNNHGNTPLYWCAYERAGTVHIEAAKLLIEHGADLAIKNNNGKTPYKHSSSIYSANCEMAKFLWSKLTAEQQAEQGPGPTVS